MLVSCLQENLKKGLGIVSRSLSGRTTLPITNNVLIKTDNGRLKLTTTNLELMISCWIGAKVEEEGGTTVPASLFLEYVNILPNDRISLKVLEKTQVTEIKCLRYESRIHGVRIDDFPPSPQDESGVVIKITAEELRKAVRLVSCAAAAGTERPVLSGVNMKIIQDTLKFAAADGFRLAVYSSPAFSFTGSMEKVDIIVPARTFLELVRILPEGDEDIEIEIGKKGNQILFRMKDIEVISQLIMGNFPEYDQLIPQSHNNSTICNTDEIIKAVKAAYIIAREENNLVRFEMKPGEGIEPGKMLVSAQVSEVGEDKAEIDAIVKGEEARIAFNSKYLLDVLNVLGEEKVELETMNSSSPGVIRGEGKWDYVYVIMPLFTQW